MTKGHFSCRPKAPSTQVRTSFGFNRPLPSPNHPLPSLQQQQQQQTQTTMKLKKEKKKPILPFHHRPLLQQDVSEPPLKCFAVMATKGLPTANSLTNDCNQKRYSDCAGPSVIAKKYVVPSHNSFNKNSTSFGTSKVNTGGNNATKMDSGLNSLTHGIKSECSFEKASDGAFFNQLFPDKSQYSVTKPIQNEFCYLLPGESSFAAPVLPGNSLDCRQYRPLPSPPPIPAEEVSKPFLER